MYFGIALVFASHWMACLFRLVIDLEQSTDEYGQPSNWATEYHYLNKLSPGRLYTTALYWSVMTITTIGYGDVVPTTPGERVTAILVMLVGASMYAYTVGMASSIVSNLDEATNHWQ